MSAKVKPWSVLRSESDDGIGIVVPEGASTAEALAELVGMVHGVDVSSAHPLIVKEAAGLKVETWRSCTKAWREAEGVGDFEEYWAPQGDGKRTANVVWYPDDVWALGDEVETENQQ